MREQFIVGVVEVNIVLEILPLMQMSITQVFFSVQFFFSSLFLNSILPGQIQVLEAEGFSNAVVFQIACTVDRFACFCGFGFVIMYLVLCSFLSVLSRSLAFVGPDSALFDFGGAKQFQLTAAAYPTVGDVLSHIGNANPFFIF